ncbi:xylulose kinase [Pyxidicoccus fallax]|uniref:Xylulose kinase n=1 Tax=Pyxidicoccus fallax TaxID=394095 RepID=A0A848LML2_9BACT|nr:FGGY-family carbohydrate kinase [Pyxidicoccus fallax]NMO18910.1 xylulose kinase [Pyxidicoccus fallax]NPC79548.1 xylulose kinase [Pyxidicoccus fallax]
MEGCVSHAGEQSILAIDLGTSAVKLAVVSVRGRILGGDVEPLDLQLLPDGGAEQDPESWWRAIVQGTRRLLASGRVRAEDIIGVNCSSQWSGTVAVDTAGRPLRPALIWMDSRGAPHVKRVADGFIPVEGYGIRRLLTWIRLSGGVPSLSGKDPVGHILYLQTEHPDVYRNTYKFLEPKDWLNLRLSGRFAASYDSITLHWVTDNRELSRVTYDERLLEMTGLKREKLPDLVPAATVLGPLQPEAARELGLREDVQVVTGAPDILAAAVGSGAVRDNEPHLCVGTSSWLSCHVPYKKTDIFHQMASVPSALQGRYLLANEQESAGICLTFLKDNILYGKDSAPGQAPAEDDSAEVYKLMERQAGTVPAGSDQLIFMPWLNGERSPVDDKALRGGFFNQSLKTTRAHMVRAVMEGVAYNSRWLFTYVEQFVGKRLDSMRIIGGGARSPLWCQIHADVLGRTIQQVDEPVLANARGAAFQAAVALGKLTVDEIPSLVPIARTYEPDPKNRALYDELFREFVNLYKANKAIFARLNRARSA